MNDLLIIISVRIISAIRRFYLAMRNIIHSFLLYDKRKKQQKIKLKWQIQRVEINIANAYDKKNIIKFKIFKKFL